MKTKKVLSLKKKNGLFQWPHLDIVVVPSATDRGRLENCRFESRLMNPFLWGILVRQQCSSSRLLPHFSGRRKYSPLHKLMFSVACCCSLLASWWRLVVVVALGRAASGPASSILRASQRSLRPRKLRPMSPRLPLQ